jgi:ATP-dependent Clp protease ATP-binding subunit ClpA
MEEMNKLTQSKKGTTKALGVLMIIIVTLASGFIFLNFVTTNVDSMKTIFNTQMKCLFLESFSANVTHIVMFIKNTQDKLVEITQAYVNQLMAALQQGKAIIAPLTTGIVTILGSFTKGNTYTVRLTNYLNIDLSFTVTI